jgi:hypothetical protein
MMRNPSKHAVATGALIAAFAATGLAAQDQNTSPAPQAPIDQGQGMMRMMGMMREMSQMMENCNEMMQAHTAQPQQPQNKP